MTRQSQLNQIEEGYRNARGPSRAPGSAPPAPVVVSQTGSAMP
ncbi:MAG TPA: hypothetical protein VF503_31155 [Sphingobium sp.]